MDDPSVSQETSEMAGPNLLFQHLVASSRDHRTNDVSQPRNLDSKHHPGTNDAFTPQPPGGLGPILELPGMRDEQWLRDEALLGTEAQGLTPMMGMSLEFRPESQYSESVEGGDAAASEEGLSDLDINTDLNLNGIHSQRIISALRERIFCHLDRAIQRDDDVNPTTKEYNCMAQDFAQLKA